jgi:hypothetical protein
MDSRTTWNDAGWIYVLRPAYGTPSLEYHARWTQVGEAKPLPQGSTGARYEIFSPFWEKNLDVGLRGYSDGRSVDFRQGLGVNDRTHPSY